MTVSSHPSALQLRRGAHFGDFFLFSEPGGAFFPTTDDDARSLTVEELTIKGEWVIKAHYGVGPGGHIFEQGKRN